VSKLVKRAAEKFEEMYESVDLEEQFFELVQTISQAFEQWRNNAWESIANQCHESKVCRQLISQIRDYEIEQFVDKHVVQQWEKMQKKMKQAMPQELIESVKEMAKQFNQVHSDDQEEEERPAKRWSRHSMRLLKMSQPEMSETMMKHFNIMSKHFYKQQPDSQQQQQQINWPELRGALHDFAVDVADQMQEKANQVKSTGEQAKPFWNKFMQGMGGNSQQQGSTGDYSKYASQWTPQSKDNETSKSNNNNFIFSPKRGEFKLDTTSQDSATFWTRA